MPPPTILTAAFTARQGPGTNDSLSFVPILWRDGMETLTRQALWRQAALTPFSCFIFASPSRRREGRDRGTRNGGLYHFEHSIQGHLVAYVIPRQWDRFPKIINFGTVADRVSAQEPAPTARRSR